VVASGGEQPQREAAVAQAGGERVRIPIERRARGQEVTRRTRHHDDIGESRAQVCQALDRLVGVPVDIEPIYPLAR
jgi:hypothetical protein